MRKLGLLFVAFASIIGAQTTATLTYPVDRDQGFVMLNSVAGLPGPGNPVANGVLSPPTGSEFGVIYIGSECMRVTRTPTVSYAPVYVERGWRGTGTASYLAGATVTLSNTSLPAPPGFPIPMFARRPNRQPDTTLTPDGTVAIEATPKQPKPAAPPAQSHPESTSDFLFGLFAGLVIGWATTSALTVRVQRKRQEP